jgi:hypothetical protein
MRLSRFFIDAPLSTGEHELPEAQAHYISRVLRMAEGDAVQMFDGSGHEFRGALQEVGKKARDRADRRAVRRPGRIAAAHPPRPGPVPWRAHGLGDPESHRAGRERNHPDLQRPLRSPPQGRTRRQTPAALASGGDQRLRTVRALAGAGDSSASVAGRLDQADRGRV